MAEPYTFLLPNAADWIIGSIALISAIICLVFYIVYFSKVKKTVSEQGAFTPVSIVIASKNELDNLKKHLPLWLEQDYPEFEIVIADDGSTDGTSGWLAPLAAENTKIRYVLLDPEYVKMRGKKIALTLGFKAARYNHFVLTDADCAPAGPQWLRKMAAPFAQGYDVVIGAAPLYKSSGFLGHLNSFESLMVSLNYLGFSLAGKTYMGVGRNLAYSRRIYDSVSGFSGHHHIPAGDDDLFVQSVSGMASIATVVDDDAFTWSEPKTTFRDYFRQKNRHLWVGKFYDKEWKRKLAILPVAQFLFWTSIIVWFFLSAFWVYPLSVLLIKLIPEWIILGLKSKIVKQGPSPFTIPFWIFFYTYWYVILGIRAFFSKKPKW